MIPSTKSRQPIPGYPFGDLLSVLGLSLMTVLLLRETITPIFPYDSWMYHLPFSSRIWGIGGGEATFHMNAIMSERFRGFPLLWEAVQGAFWAATGVLSAISVPQTVLMVIYLIVCQRYLIVPAGWVSLGLCACPMVLLHLQATYSDLPAAIVIAIALFFMTDLLAAESTRMNWRIAAGAVTCFAIAGNIKYQALIACFVVAGIAGCECLIPSRSGAARRIVLIAILAVSLVAASASAIKNFLQFGNPVYPEKVVLAGKTVFDGPEDPIGDAEPPAYLLRGSRSISLPGPLNFVLSMTELDWTMRGVAPWYNIDSVSGRQPRRGPPSRTGGWGMAFVAVNLILLLIQLRKIRSITDRSQRWMLINAAVLTVLTAFLPRSHELRYWMYLPLIWVPVNVRYLWQQDPKIRTTAPLLVGMAGIGMSLTVLSPKSGMLELETPFQSARLANVPAEIRNALVGSGIYCDPTEPNLFIFSSAITGLNGILSTNALDCPPASH